MLRLLCLLALTVLAVSAQSPAAAIRDVMDKQTEAWNRGDLATFVNFYENSPETTFVGKTMSHGRDGLLERYRKSYATQARMGRLDFTDLNIRPLSPEYAFVIGRFHLTRAAEAGGEASGVFTLLFHKTPEGWRILVDHTS